MTFSETTAPAFDTDPSVATEMSYACTRCGDEKAESCYGGVFNKQYQKWYRHKTCNTCRASDANAYNKAHRLKHWTFRVLQSARSSTCNYLRRKNKKMDKVDLTPKYLEQIYQEQSGRCYYFGTVFELSGGMSLTSITLDRIDCSKGYVQGNVVLACRAANMARNDSSVDDMLELVKMIKRS